MPTKSTVVATPAILLASFVAGCGGGAEQLETAAVTGKVTYGGQNVTGGTLTFTPKASGESPGKPGSAPIGSDGTFTVGTYGKADGAVVGAHRISYSAPSPEAPADSDEHTPSKPSPYANLVPRESEVVVKAGKNDLTIELVKP